VSTLDALMTLPRHLRAALAAAALLAAALPAAALLAAAPVRASAPAAPEALTAVGASNPPAAEIRDLLYQAAVAHDIPPKILYAVAWQESTWRQFNAAGGPLISGDGGIGIMQVTSIPDGVDAGRLRTDIAYNIEVGASILDEKWTYAPSVFPVIGQGDRRCYEDWFFAVWAYNGWTAGNLYPYLIWGHIADGRGHWTGLAVTPVGKSRLVNGFPPAGAAVATPQPEHWWSATRLPKPVLSAPRVQKRVGAGDRFSVSGLLSPAHAAGAHSVELRAHRWNGSAWVLRRTLLTTNRDAGDATRWAVTFALGKTGRWRLTAAALPDADHAAATSRAAVFTVVR
jgi:hypothetical protein